MRRAHFGKADGAWDDGLFIVNLIGKTQMRPGFQLQPFEEFGAHGGDIASEGWQAVVCGGQADLSRREKRVRGGINHERDERGILPQALRDAQSSGKGARCAFLIVRGESAHGVGGGELRKHADAEEIRHADQIAVSGIAGPRRRLRREDAAIGGVERWSRRFDGGDGLPVLAHGPPARAGVRMNGERGEIDVVGRREFRVENFARELHEIPLRLCAPDHRLAFGGGGAFLVKAGAHLLAKHLPDDLGTSVLVAGFERFLKLRNREPYLAPPRLRSRENRARPRFVAPHKRRACERENGDARRRVAEHAPCRERSRFHGEPCGAENGETAGQKKTLAQVRVLRGLGAAFREDHRGEPAAERPGPKRDAQKPALRQRRRGLCREPNGERREQE